MVTRMDNRCNIFLIKSFQGLFGNSRGSHCDVKNLCNSSVDATLIGANSGLHDVASHHASLLVCRAGKIAVTFLTGDGIWENDGIAQGKDIRIAGLQVFVDANSLVQAQFQTGCFSELAIRTDADGKNHHVRGDCSTAFELYLQSALFTNEGTHCVFEIELHVFGLEMTVNQSCHLIIQRSHDLFCHLHDCHFDAEMVEVFCHLESDETGADDHNVTNRMRLGIFLDFIGIRNVSQGENCLIIDTGDGRSERLCTGRKNELVIVFAIFAAVFAANQDSFFLSIDRDYFLFDAHIDV